jgi:transcriptional regulator with XRE-family HTH domain
MASGTGTSRRNRGDVFRRRAQDMDLHVAARLRERRMTLGMTLQRLAGLVGVTHQQAHKYEKGVNRIAAGHLCQMAEVLGVEVGYFFEGVDGSIRAFEPTPPQLRLLCELTRSFTAIPDERHRAALRDLARVLTAEPANAHDELAAE